MNEPEMMLPFSESEIDYDNYTFSLLCLCTMHKIITNPEFIKNEIDKIFVENANQYSKREKSSLPIKTAREIYNSILYTSDVYLRSLNNNYFAVQTLCRTKFDLIILKGQQLIMQYFEESRLIFKKAFELKFNFNVYEYQYVMNTAFDIFYKNYSARFNAQDICTSIDYPLINMQAYEVKLKGVIFIHYYYTAIYLENKFLKLFDEKKIEAVLKAYGKIYSSDYRNLHINLAEPVFLNLIGGILSDRGFSLDFCVNDIKVIECRYSYMNENEIKQTIEKIFCEYSCKINDNEVFQYIKKNIPWFALQLHIHLNNETISNFIPAI